MRRGRRFFQRGQANAGKNQENAADAGDAKTGEDEDLHADQDQPEHEQGNGQKDRLPVGVRLRPEEQNEHDKRDQAGDGRSRHLEFEDQPNETR